VLSIAFKAVFILCRQLLEQLSVTSLSRPAVCLQCYSLLLLYCFGQMNDDLEFFSSAIGANSDYFCDFGGAVFDLCGARGRCRISLPCFLVECRKKRLNQGSFVSAMCLVVFFDSYCVFCDLY